MTTEATPAPQGPDTVVADAPTDVGGGTRTRAERRAAAFDKVKDMFEPPDAKLGESEEKPAETGEKPESPGEQRSEAGEKPAEPAKTGEQRSDKPPENPWDKIRAKAEESYQQRQTQQQQQQEASRIQQLERELETMRNQQTVQGWSEKLRKSPRQALIDAGLDPSEYLQQLTQDMLNPGAEQIRAQNEQGMSEIEALKAKIQQLEQQDQMRAQKAQVTEYERDFLDSTKDPERFPLLSKVNDQRRLALGVDVWNRIRNTYGEAAVYDRDQVAEIVEYELSQIQQELAPAPKPEEPKKDKAASAGTGQPKKSAPKTLTADLAAQSSGAPRTLTRDERKKRAAARLERQWAEETLSKSQ